MKTIFTVKEIADEWKVDQSTINRLCASGALKATKFGKQWRIKESDLNAYIESRTIKNKVA